MIEALPPLPPPALLSLAVLERGEGLLQLGELGLALLLSAAIGLEREIRQKSAGLRTHTLVGVGAALFMLISKYGFTDVLVPGQVVLDPSRVAAQIVTGVGFLGAGLIFVRRDAVRGLTTAAAVWVTAAVGAAAAAGLPLLAVATTVIYFLVALVFPPLARRLPRSMTAASAIRLRYPAGQGVLRQVIELVTERGFSIAQLATRGAPEPEAGEAGEADQDRVASPLEAMVEVNLQVHGRGSVQQLAALLAELPGVDAVVASDVNVIDESP